LPLVCLRPWSSYLHLPRYLKPQSCSTMPGLLRITSSSQAWWLTPAISATQMAEIKRIKDMRPAWGKSLKTSLHKLGMVACACHPSYVGGCDWEDCSPGQPRRKVCETPSQQKRTECGGGVRLSSQLWGKCKWEDIVVQVTPSKTH
jgi:hypothetical protein